MNAVPLRQSRREVKAESVSEQRRSNTGSAKIFALSAGLLILPLVLFSLVQYLRYGFGLFLGWDTSLYVWWAKQVYANGPIWFILNSHYPHLYVLALAGFGVLLGSASLAERLLPFVIASPLAYAYYRLTLGITKDRRIAYFGALLGGTTVNTLRLFSDLNRNLMSFGLVLVIGVMISAQLSSRSSSLQLQKRQMILLWLPLMAIAAYTEIEIYAILMLTMLLQFLSIRNLKTTIFGSLFLALPILISLPLTWPFISSYGAGLSLQGLPPPTVPSVLLNSVIFLGGLALPWTMLGLGDVVRRARRGNQTANFLVLWLVALLLLSPLSIEFGLPIVRLLFVVPLPAIVAAGVLPSVRYTRALVRRAPLNHIPIRWAQVSRQLVLTTTMSLLLASSILTSVAASDAFLRPYASTAEINRLTEAASIVRQLGYNQPILVMYGSLPADLNPIYRAYFSGEIPDSLAYYGRVQYLFTLPDPSQVYQFQFDAPNEQASSLRYRTEILNSFGSPSGVASHAIVIAGGQTYDRPLSELFISSQFEVMPGIYIIPPARLTPTQIDSWRFCASSDWTSTTTTTTINATWAQSPNTPVLYWVGKGPNSQFEANYTVSLARQWNSMLMTLHFFDWPRFYLFPDSSNVSLAPLEIYFDGNLLQHSYGGQGPSFIYMPLSNVNAGIHRVTIRSGSPGQGVAAAIDYLQVVPTS
jgi:hypothetical protein